MKLLTNIFVWIFAILLTATVLIYQRMTGPTYPKRITVEVEGQEMKFKLLRSWEKEKTPGEMSHVPLVNVGDMELEGFEFDCKYKRNNTADEWTTISMLRVDEDVVAVVPTQPPAGKLAYVVRMKKGDETYMLTEEPIVIRFKDHIPGWVPPPHVLLIFTALLFSTMTAVEALRRGKRVYAYAVITIISMLVGGLIMGPIMQKFAFGAYWTGWPFGQDLTDNKTLLAFIFWVIAFFVLRKNRKNRFWPVLAALVTLAVFLIPHSVLGSEFDYSAGEVVTGR
jgi:hypothetical protein